MDRMNKRQGADNYLVKTMSYYVTFTNHLGQKPISKLFYCWAEYIQTVSFLVVILTNLGTVFSVSKWFLQQLAVMLQSDWQIWYCR